MSSFNFYVRSEHYGPVNLQGFIVKTLDYFQHIMKYLPELTQIDLLGRDDYVTVDVNREDIAEAIENYLRSANSCSALDEASNEIMLATGFRVPFFFERKLPADARTTGRIVDQMSIQLGGTAPLSSDLHILWQFSCEPTPEIMEAYVKPLFIETINFWQASKGRITSYNFHQNYRNETWQPTGKADGSLHKVAEYNGSIDIGWVTYLRYLPLVDFLPDEIAYEVLPNGGILAFTGQDQYADNNAEQLEAARKFHKVLDNIHLQKNPYALDGWPYDPEEISYAQQITGAPENRKYLVQFCYFDGYDAELDVLLYARLFRYFPILGENINSNNEHLDWIVAEARRQLAAVNTAQSETTIEWHIGIEKHADSLKALFSQYEDISEAQLRVIYTSPDNEV